MDDERMRDSWMEEAPRRSGRSTYLVALFLAFIVFEFTADPSLVVIVGCSKFGWEQILTARWLRKNDPDRDRGRACRWFYLSWGLWRISLVATILMFVIVFALQGLKKLLGAPQQGVDGPPIQFVVAFAIACVGFSLSTFTLLFGMAAAWKARIPVWIGREPIAARKARSWPPSTQLLAQNKIHGLMLTAIPFTWVLVVVPIAAIVTAIVASSVRHALGPKASELTYAGAGLVTMVGGIAGLIVLTESAKARMAAGSVSQCWPKGQEVTPPSSSQSAFGSAFR